MVPERLVIPVTLIGGVRRNDYDRDDHYDDQYDNKTRNAKRTRDINCESPCV